MEETSEEYKWYEGDEDSSDSGNTALGVYDISASPNDFNVSTLFDFINSGMVRIPGFQRNYVWDIKRASKFIESIVIGIPIPQIFLFEESRNRFIVIDGQQRYMTIYYFMKMRFPKEENRFNLRRIFDEHKGIPENILDDNDYFVDFKLQLMDRLSGTGNPLHNLSYDDFDEKVKIAFDLRTIRNIIIKQNFPEGEDSIIFEIFSRLNSGGVNLSPQEMRSGIYHSKFYEMIYDLNLSKDWRLLINKKTPDLYLKDIEIILRAFAMLIEGANYTPPMIKFINRFSNIARKYPQDSIDYLRSLFTVFLDVCKPFGSELFSIYGGFNISLFEATFVACCQDAFNARTLKVQPIDTYKVAQIKHYKEIAEELKSDTTSAAHVVARMQWAKDIFV
ncbi:MAG: DUF262 domain-containing protein [Candidatus Magnetobacterium sp. LHC-1]|nr:DUF262 domain-containing protein [Nitrospirota bacterium]